MRRLLFAVPFLIVALVPAAAAATLGLALDLSELVGRADAIVVATAEEQHALYDDRGRIVTDVTFRVEEQMKGRLAPGARFVVRSLGGAVGDIGMHVEGEPFFRN